MCTNHGEHSEHLTSSGGALLYVITALTTLTIYRYRKINEYDNNSGMMTKIS